MSEGMKVSGGSSQGMKRASGNRGSEEGSRSGGPKSREGKDGENNDDDRERSEGPPGLARRGFIPPGIAKKLPPPLPPLLPVQTNPLISQQFPAAAVPVNPLPVAPVSAPQVTAQPLAAVNNNLNTALFGATQPVTVPISTPVANPIAQATGLPFPQSLTGPPGILEGVPQAFATGNPLAGPIQLVNNINSNALATLQAAGLA